MTADRKPTEEERVAALARAKALAADLRAQGHDVEVVENIQWVWKVIVKVPMKAATP
jgi:hypothetical protein